MTGIPGGLGIYGPQPNNPGNNNAAAMNALTAAMNNTFNRVIGNNTQSLNNLGNTILNFGNLANNLTLAFRQADTLQRKSQAIGSSLNKLLDFNKDTLGKLRGDFFANAEELLNNFSHGIRDNSDELNFLQNRMKLTGQDTQLAREVMGDLLMETGGNIDAVSRLSDVTHDLSLKNKITAESLLRVVDALSPVRQLPSFLGLSEQFNSLTLALQSTVGEKGQEEVIKAMNLIFDPKNISTLFALGIGSAPDKLLDSSLSQKGQLMALRDILNTANGTLQNIAGSNKGNLKAVVTDAQLRSLGDKEGLIALSNLTNILNTEYNKTNSFLADQNKNLDSIKTINDEARSYYQMATGKVFPLLLNVLPSLLAGSMVTNLGGGIGAAGNLLGARTGGAALRGIGGIIGVLGPVGAIVGTVISFLPEIKSLFSSNSDKQDEANKHLASIDKKTNPPPPNESKGTGTFSQFLANTIFDAQTGSKKTQETLNANIADTMKMIGDFTTKTSNSFNSDLIVNRLDELIKLVQRNGGSIPSKAKGI